MLGNGPPRPTYLPHKGLPAKTGDEAFLAGLMHEIGRFILIDNFPGEFKAACDKARQTASPLAACLREVFQASSSQVGAYILELWGLPDPVIAAVAALDNPQNDPANGFTICAALFIADHIASAKFPPDSFPVEELKPEYLKSVGCVDQFPAWEQSSPRRRAQRQELDTMMPRTDLSGPMPVDP